MDVIDDHGIMLGYVLRGDWVVMMSVGGLLIHVEVLFQSKYEPDHGYPRVLTTCFGGFLMSGVALHVASLHGWSIADSFR